MARLFAGFAQAEGKTEFTQLNVNYKPRTLL